MFCWTFILFLSLSIGHARGQLHIFAKHNGTWMLKPSLFKKEGDLLDIQCRIENISYNNDTIELKWRRFDSVEVIKHLASSKETPLCYSFNLTADVSGTYFCYFRSLVSMMTINVVKGINITNATARTDVSMEEISGNILPRRTLSSNQANTFMTCECVFDTKVPLHLIFVSWNSPKADGVELLDNYIFETWRDELSRVVGSRLALRNPSLDPLDYGKYSCVFRYYHIGSVHWDVYLYVAPIVKLGIMPPPPPLLSTGLNDSSCSSTNSSSVIIKRWMSACSIIVAYPPVEVVNHFWNWSNPGNSMSIIRANRRLLDNLEQIISEVNNDSSCQGLLVPQNPSSSIGGPTVFWCYAKNQVDASGIWWPNDYKNGPLSSTIMWPLGFLVLQVLCGIGVVVWECYCHRRKNIHYITRHTGRLRSTADAFSLVASGPEDGAEHLRLSNSGTDKLTNPKKALEIQPNTAASGDADAYFWDDYAAGKPIGGNLEQKQRHSNLQHHHRRPSVNATRLH